MLSKCLVTRRDGRQRKEKFINQSDVLGVEATPLHVRRAMRRSVQGEHGSNGVRLGSKERSGKLMRKEP